MAWGKPARTEKKKKTRRDQEVVNIYGSGKDQEGPTEYIRVGKTVAKLVVTGGPDCGKYEATTVT